MDQLTFTYHGETDGRPTINLNDTDFDDVIFSIDNFEFGDLIEDTEDDAMVYFDYVIIENDPERPVVDQRLEDFLDVVRKLVDQIIRNAVKDL